MRNGSLWLVNDIFQGYGIYFFCFPCYCWTARVVHSVLVHACCLLSCLLSCLRRDAGESEESLLRLNTGWRSSRGEVGSQPSLAACAILVVQGHQTVRSKATLAAHSLCSALLMIYTDIAFALGCSGMMLYP